MKVNKEFVKLFTMTRSERIGTYVVLAAMALVLIVTLSYRSCKNYSDVSKHAEEIITRAEQVQIVSDSINKAKQDSIKAHARKKKAHKKNKTAKTGEPDRPLHEVPQY